LDSQLLAIVDIWKMVGINRPIWSGDTGRVNHTSCLEHIVQRWSCWFLPSFITAYSHWYNAKDTCLADHNTFVFIGIGMMETKQSVCGHVLGLHHLPSVSFHNIQPCLRKQCTVLYEYVVTHGANKNYLIGKHSSVLCCICSLKTITTYVYSLILRQHVS